MTGVDAGGVGVGATGEGPVDGGVGLGGGGGGGVAAAGGGAVPAPVRLSDMRIASRPKLSPPMERRLETCRGRVSLRVFSKRGKWHGQLSGVSAAGNLDGRLVRQGCHEGQRT